MSNPATALVDPYHAIARYYDLEHDPFADDLEFLVPLADAIAGPILEMGCGTGRVVAALAEAGHRVVGIDASLPMLQRARARLDSLALEGEATLVEADMADVTGVAGGPFSLVVYSLNALTHLADPIAQLSSLRNAQHAMMEGGTLVLDLPNPTPDYLSSIDGVTLLEGSWMLEDGRTVDKWAHRAIDPVRQVIATTIWYDVLALNGGVRRLRTAFDLRYVHASEARLMLEMAGFSEVQAYGSYTLDPLDAGSDRLIFTATRNPAGSRAIDGRDPLQSGGGG